MSKGTTWEIIIDRTGESLGFVRNTDEEGAMEEAQEILYDEGYAGEPFTVVELD